MVARTADAVRPWVDEVVVVSSRPVESAPARVIPDRVSGAGPLGGLDAALAEAVRLDLGGVVLVACDLPLVTSAVVGALVSQLGDADAVAPARAPSGVEPLCAVYRVGVRSAVEARLQGPDRSLHALFRDVGGRVAPVESFGDQAGRAFLNVNTPSDVDRAEAALSRKEDR